MSTRLASSILLACLALTSCADSVSTTVATNPGPEAPINEPDPGVFNPGGGAGTGPIEPAGGGSATGASSADSLAMPGDHGGGSMPPPAGPGNGEGGATPGAPMEGSGGPVPEPSTLLLFGSGLVGVGASLMRRRRKQHPESV